MVDANPKNFKKCTIRLGVGSFKFWEYNYPGPRNGVGSNEGGRHAHEEAEAPGEVAGAHV